MDAPHRPPRQPDGHGRREEEQAPSFLDFPVVEDRTPAGITPDGSTLWLDEYQMMVGARLPAVLAGRGKSAFGMQMIADLMASGRDMECAVTDLKGAPEPDPPPAFAQGDMLLLDVVPLSLGLETMGGVVEKIIHRNTTVPCGATQTFTTFADRQTGFELKVVQGERELADQCRSLAQFTLKGIPPMPAGMARLEVTFTVDADGILRVAAREETTGQEAKIEVKPSYGLTDEEVERMLLDSFAHAEEDVQIRLLTEQQVEADRIAAAARTAMADSPELLTPEDRTGIDAALAALATARGGKDHHAIRAAVEGLDRASKEFAARRMNVAFDRGLRGKDVASVEAKADETAPKRDLASRAGSHTGHSH